MRDTLHVRLCELRIVVDTESLPAKLIDSFLGQATCTMSSTPVLPYPAMTCTNSVVNVRNVLRYPLDAANFGGLVWRSDSTVR